ncbi:MAG TPA: GAF domain-containing protein, partial [Thermoanaerobaculia bacterium]|nr:GAF domain-containing protein [Thermoanaerobaculia bacterium]
MSRDEDDDGTPTGFLTDAKRAARVQSALYEIAATASSASDLAELYAAIHAILGSFLYARNLSISLHEKERERLRFPYFVDEKDSAPESLPFGRGLIERVLTSGRPLHVGCDEHDALVLDGALEARGAPFVDWLGVPLRAGGPPFGVLALKCYSEETRFSPADEEILTFVSH